MSDGGGRSLDDARLRAILHRLDPAAHLRRARPLDGGASATMTALEITRGDGRRETVIVRLPGPVNLRANPNSAADEHRLLDLLADHDIPAPPPLLLDTSREIVAVDYLVVGWLEGRVTFAPPDPRRAGEAMAELLARIHAVPVDGRLGFLPRRGDPFTPPQAGLAEDHPARLDEATLATLRELWSRLPKPAPVLLHGDVWPGNMLWRQGRPVAVLDWEDAAVGDPLADLAIARLDIAIFFGEPAMRAFTERYRRLSGRDLAALPFWDLSAARRAPADYGTWGEGWAELGRPDITAAAMDAARAKLIHDALAGLAPMVERLDI